MSNLKKQKNKKNEYVIGIDGGATKTVAALANLKGKIKKIAKSGSSNARKIGIKKAVENITKAIKKVLPKNGKIVSTFIGLPALEEEYKTRKNIIKRTLLKEKGISRIFKGKLKIGSDQIVAFKSGTDKENGVMLIAGTGCVAHGWHNEKEAKASGWGYLTDQGSAFWVGLRTFQAIWKDLDGRDKKTLVTKLVFKKFKIKQKEKLLNLVYSKNLIKIIPFFSIICDIASKRGDRIAKKIMKDAAIELTLSVKTVIRKLKFRKIEFPLVLVGGMFKSKIVLRNLKKEIKKFTPKIKIILQKKEPVIGAVKLAIENLEN